ncbi:MAG: acetyl-CoA carboxylase biotin carboxyl carrier protein subunit [Gemmatimonadetes bacterium]|nr:acetyl-CoA carboxylase biotin carboxyl carrier protein subunit [Gemmatimonadota bacterium]
MKYFVRVAGREILVEVDGERVTVGGRSYSAHLSRLPATPLRHLLADGRSLTLAVEAGAPGEWALSVRGTRVEAEVIDERTRHIRSLTAARAGSGPVQLKAPMPGLVVRVLVTEGQAVAAGQGLLVLEAMKMENELRASGPATVARVGVQPGQAVEKGQVLVEFGGAPLT